MSDKYNNSKIKEILCSEKIPERLEPENIKKSLESSGTLEKRSRIRRNKIMRIVSAAAAVALAAGTSFYFMRPKLLDGQIVPKSSFAPGSKQLSAVSLSTMKPAAEYKDVYSYFFAARTLNKIKDRIYGYKDNMNSMVAVEEVAEEAADDYVQAENGADYVQSSSRATGTSDMQKEYSDTYSQVNGVMEADIVKTDGDNIFYASEDTIYAAKAENGKFIDSYKSDVSDLLNIDMSGYITDMYIYENKLITICQYTQETEQVYSGGCIVDDCYISDQNTYVAVFDISDRLEPSGYYVQEGIYNDVRMTSDGFLYLVTDDTKYFGSDSTADDIANYIPECGVNGELSCVSPEDIMIPSDKLLEVYDYVSYTNISGFNIGGEAPYQPVDTISVAGYSNTIYCTQNNLYIAAGYDNTDITRFAISGGSIVPSSSGTVKGCVHDQFSMSEYNGYFRIAVTEDVWSESGGDLDLNNSVYVLDMNMNVVGSVSGFGLNETIRSVNFSGDKAYVVTFRQTDPLYAIDLSDPANPVILDEFKISGYSSYMQKWSDGLLLGFGAEADEETGWETGVKMTMFDNRDPENLNALDSVVLEQTDEESYISSEAVYERKALFVDYERNLIGFPVQICTEYDTNYYSYRFYSFEKGEFTYKGAFEKSDSSYEKECYRRAVYIDGYLYAVSMDEFIAADASSITVTDKIIF